MYSPIQQNPPVILDQGPQRERKCCYHSACWTFQWLSWGSLIASIILYAKVNVSSYIFLSFGVCYLTYIFLEILSPTSNYLCNKSSEEGIYNKMGNYFRTPPEIHFICECYHFENRTRYTKDEKGHKHAYKVRVSVTTYSETFVLPYYSERDVSGLFYLNSDEAHVQRKRYIKLDLKDEINFADAISYYDYERAKADFWRRNRFRDVHFSFREKRTIPGLEENILIKLSDEEPCVVSCFWFMIFTFLAVAEFFRLYFNSICVYQKFKIRKIISTRYDLNQEAYQVFVPQLNLITQQFQYEPQYYNHINQNYDLQLPTQEELEAAKQYQDKIPVYQVSSGGVQYQIGVIVENPGYSSYNPNEAPAEFAAVSGNVALAQDQICTSGGPPPNYNQPGFQFNIAPNEQNDENAPGEIGYVPPKV